VLGLGGQEGVLERRIVVGGGPVVVLQVAGYILESVVRGLLVVKAQVATLWGFLVARAQVAMLWGFLVARDQVWFLDLKVGVVDPKVWVRGQLSLL